MGLRHAGRRLDCVPYPRRRRTGRSEGLLAERSSLWRERTLTSWSLVGAVNFFRVAEFRSVAPKQREPKGVSEGSEVQVSWKSRFAKAAGSVTSVASGRLDYKLGGEDKESHFRLGPDERPFLRAGDRFAENEVVAGQVVPLTETTLPMRRRLWRSGGREDAAVP